MTYELPLVLTFSASDPTAGAGMQADLLTVSAMGAHALTVLTGMTAQNTSGVSRFEPCSADWVQAQVDCLMLDAPRIRAIKAGVLGSVDNLRVLVNVVNQCAQAPLVLDPVMASGRGDALGMPVVFDTMKAELFPHVTLLTPNWPEAKALTGKRTAPSAAKYLLDLGCKAVLIKGEHVKSDNVVNRLYLASGETFDFPCERLPGQYHGSGCTLASACAAALAQGMDLADAVELALGFTWSSLQRALKVGKGQLIPDRMHLMHEMSQLMNMEGIAP
ncbi:MAG: hydroxymethylpyrimidine/phosphomethylpyrimidine kinase [Limnobacter sp.]|nr:hydroxymethylpyrimidine/phosphomethylpyrimidine kinase [Limnobacter sp.]